MVEKVYKTKAVHGILTTLSGKEYWLVYPDPIHKDWEQDRQQRYLVVPKESIGNDDDSLLYGYPRHLVCTDPEIEFLYENKSIKVEDLEDWVIEGGLEPETSLEDKETPVDVINLLNALGEPKYG